MTEDTNVLPEVKAEDAPLAPVTLDNPVDPSMHASQEDVIYVQPVDDGVVDAVTEPVA